MDQTLVHYNFENHRKPQQNMVQECLYTKIILALTKILQLSSAIQNNNQNFHSCKIGYKANSRARVISVKQSCCGYWSKKWDKITHHLMAKSGFWSSFLVCEVPTFSSLDYKDLHQFYMINQMLVYVIELNLDPKTEPRPDSTYL